MHFLKLGNVGFSKNILGYFRCRHCDIMLKQQRYAGMIAKFDPKFWIVFPLFFVMVIFLPELLTDLIVYLFPSLKPENPAISDGQIPPIFFIYGIIFIVTLIAAFVIFFQAMFRYMKFKAAQEDDLSRDKTYKISLAGWVIFAVFLIIYLFSGYLILNSSELFISNEWMYPVSLVVYLLVLIGISALISKHFSSSEESSASDKPV